ncbi:hypothetical protein H6F67_12105 [Microcoleus sp. FACHB-1515]|uniref:hypothetical protein n=1 Tax=Cyanophyceae TaxID=3028117 RepID=UPI001682FD60|nr:hypothetical protein [Microcoleus sp. FACHB-1515]MBD2090597.1 hypothetical protein [Microcoleus sp. FACHB-1515]
MRFSLLLLSGIGLTASLLWLSWTMYDRYISDTPSSQVLAVSFQGDPYVKAMELAAEANFAGKRARSSTDWFEIANLWQQAADLMAVVPDSDNRHKAAQDRAAQYRRNSAYARRKAEANL